MIYYKVSVIDTAGGTCYALMSRDEGVRVIDQWRNALADTMLCVNGVTDEARKGEVKIVFRRESVAGVMMERL